jgi:endonuclease-3
MIESEDSTNASALEPAVLPASAVPAPQPLDRRARAARILEILDRYFPTVDIPLDHGDSFQLLVAVILSAQCTDARVNLVTPALFARAPDAAAMAKLRADQILPYIRSCGLAPGKAKAIAKMSRILIAEHGGEVPNDLAALEELPGVGHKTASVVMAQAFHVPAFPVDTHIHRLAGRWQLSRARTVEEVERDLKAVFPRDRWNTLHLQIIYFGRQYCPARNHGPARCPICSWAMSKARADAELHQGLSKPVRRAKPGRERAPSAPRTAPADRDHPARTAKPARPTKPSRTAPLRSSKPKLPVKPT